MENSARDCVREAVEALRELLLQAREALAGRQDFAVAEIRAISKRLGQMEPIVSRARELRANDPELDSNLKTYAEILRELQTALEQVRFMLLAKQAQLGATRGHLETVNLWATAYTQTR